MAQIALARSFVEALADLEPVNVKRTAAFLDKLLEEPQAAGLHSEMVHGAKDRSIRSLRVTVDLRAIAQRLGSELLLLFVGQHDEAYSWARAHCTGCDQTSARSSISVRDDVRSPLEPAYATVGAREFNDGTGASSRAATAAVNWACTVEDGQQLCRVLEEAGIEHGLAH